MKFGISFLIFAAFGSISCNTTLNIEQSVKISDKINIKDLISIFQNDSARSYNQNFQLLFSDNNTAIEVQVFSEVRQCPSPSLEGRMIKCNKIYRESEFLPTIKESTNCLRYDSFQKEIYKLFVRSSSSHQKMLSGVIDLPHYDTFISSRAVILTNPAMYNDSTCINRILLLQAI